MKIMIMTIGTRGDVQPYVALGRALMESGHEVTIFTIGDEQPDDDADVIRSPGLNVNDSGYYLTLGYSRQAQHMLRQMDILHCHHLFMSVELAHRYGRGRRGCPRRIEARKDVGYG